MSPQPSFLPGFEERKGHKLEAFPEAHVSGVKIGNGVKYVGIHYKTRPQSLSDRPKAKHLFIMGFPEISAVTDRAKF